MPPKQATRRAAPAGRKAPDRRIVINAIELRHPNTSLSSRLSSVAGLTEIPELEVNFSVDEHTAALFEDVFEAVKWGEHVAKLDVSFDWPDDMHGYRAKEMREAAEGMGGMEAAEERDEQLKAMATKPVAELWGRLKVKGKVEFTTSEEEYWENVQDYMELSDTGMMDFGLALIEAEGKRRAALGLIEATGPASKCDVYGGFQAQAPQ